MKTKKLARHLASVGLAGGLALVMLLASVGTASAKGTRVSVGVQVGAPAFAHHRVHHPVVVHRHFVRPRVVHPVVPKPVFVVPRAAVSPSTGVVFTPPAPVVVVPKWVWTGNRWEWHSGGRVWVPGHWQWSHSQWIWIQGHWTR